jgi:hypothetical protein
MIARWWNEPVSASRLTFFRVFYCMCAVYSIFVYARGYDLHFRYVSVPEGSNCFADCAW